MGVGFERRAAPRAIAGRGGETAAAFRTELRVRFGAGTMVGTNGMRDAGCGMRRGSGYPASRISHLASRWFGAECGKRFGSVPRLQDVVVGSGLLARRAIELDLLHGPQRARAGL